ncbi:MAG TPA: hypothetical protein VFS97_15050 [Nitrososphaeraceae archaeon]|nr:hypothetical protein [Nitrososphaeraceae archaeon]
MKMVYHCSSCKKYFADIDVAKEHSKSFFHEVAEEIRGAGEEGKSLLM